MEQEKEEEEALRIAVAEEEKQKVVANPEEQEEFEDYLVSRFNTDMSVALSMKYLLDDQRTSDRHSGRGGKA